jgi:thioredoxin 1
MINRRHFAFATAIAGFLIAAPASAGEVPFTAAAFEAAQKAGKHTLVAVHADWCPVCKRQAPILSKIYDDPKYKDMVVLRVDFDSQKPVVQGFNVQKQSTLIVYKGSREVGRSTGDTNAESIEQLIAKGI